jgi:hypothetical protein
MVLKIDGVFHGFIVYLSGSLNGILPYVLKVTQCNLVGNLGLDIGARREPDIERCTGCGVLGYLDVLERPRIAGLERRSLAEQEVDTKPGLL